MNPKERIVYGLVMALVVFLIGQVVLGVGSLLINILFAIAMGLFAIFAVTLAAKIGKNRKR